MADEDYNKKIESLQRYIPFLVNMMTELKAKGNREAQLLKMQSLHSMITDSSKKLKLDTLNKCEEVLNNIYLKVNPQLHKKITPTSTPERAIESPNTLPGIESPKAKSQIMCPPEKDSPTVLSKKPTKITESPTVRSKIVDVRKPVISLDEVAHDVQQRISDVEYASKTVDELQEVKKQLQLQLRVEQLTEEGSKSKRKSKKQSTSPIKEIKSPTSHKKSGSNKKDENKTLKDGTKAVKEFNMFGNLFPAATEEKKNLKKLDRRSSTGSLDSEGKKSKEHHDIKDKEKHKNKKKDGGKSKSESRHLNKEKKQNNQDDNKSNSQTSLKTEENSDKKIIEKITAIDINSLKNTAKKFEKMKTLQNLENKAASNEDTKLIDSDVKSVNNEPDTKPVFKRLADKFNPKPKPPPIELPDIDKAVSDSIESTMGTSQIKPLINPVGNNILREPKNPVQLPEILQKIFSKPLLGSIIPKKDETLIPFLNDPRSKSGSTPIKPLIQNLESPLSPPPQPKPVFFQPPRYIPPEPLIETVPPSSELLERPFRPRGAGLLPTPTIQPNFSNVFDRGEVNMDLGTPRADFGASRLDFNSVMTPRADFDSPATMTPRLDFNSVMTPRADFDSPTTMTPRLDFNSVMTPRADFDSPTTMTPRLDFTSPPKMNFDSTQFLGNNQFNNFSENQMHNFDGRNANNFMGHGHFGQQPDQFGQQPNHFVQQPDVNNFNPYDLAQNALIQQQAMNMSNNFNSYDAPQGFYPGGNQGRDQYFSEQQNFYRERQQWKGRDRERDRRPKGPRNYGEYKEMRERQEREARAAQEKKAIKDPRLEPRETRDESMENTNEETKDKSADTKDPRVSRGRDKSRTRDKSPNSKEIDLKDPKTMARFEDSKFDKMYSTNRSSSPPKKENEEVFTSPLDSLYNAGSKGKTGRGYGVQSFKIPKKSKREEILKEEKNKEEKQGSEKRYTNKDKRNSSIETRSSGSSSSRKRITSETDESDVNDVFNIVDDADNENVLFSSTKVEDVIGDKEAEVEKPKETAPKYEVIIKPKVDVWIADEAIEENNFVSEYDLEFQNESKRENAITDDIESENEPNKVESAKKTKESESGTESSAKANKTVGVFSSQDNLEKNSKQKDLSSIETPIKESFAVEANEIDNSSKKVDKPQETTGSKGESAVLAQFFEHLLKSQSKQDKKTALFSIIQTFSDSFDDREIQKIRKIIQADDHEQLSDEEEKTNKETPKEQQIVSTTSEENNLRIKDLTNTEATTRASNETQVNEVTESIKDPEIDKQRIELNNQEGEYLESEKPLEPILVSVGERIKNRKRQGPAPKKKNKTELDLLHEDIQDMFIRDGVLTANGKRMCRILKDGPNALFSPEGSATSPTPSGESTQIRRRGPKRKVKSNPEISSVPLKQIKIVLNKMPDDVLSAASTRSRQTSLAESELETLENENVSYDGGMSDFENESLKEFEDTAKPKPKRRKAPKWASGIISKPKKKKLQELKDSSPVRSGSVASSNVCEASLSDLEMEGILAEPDKDYYYDFTNKIKLKCKLCHYSGHLMTSHYLKEHPESEVLTSRFPPQVAAEAIEDFNLNGKTFENLTNKLIFKSKYRYSCRICGYTSNIAPLQFYEHVTTHTGEYRHQCGFCEYVAVTGKTMVAHYVAVHPDKDKNENAARTQYNFGVVFGYMCSECNFVQLQEKSVQDHVNIFHLGDKATIHKINMSTVVDPEIIKFASGDFNMKVNDSPVKIRKKPGPKPKKKPPIVEDKFQEDVLVDKSPVGAAPEIGKIKKPGPKSKTMPFVAENESDIPESPPSSPHRKKPNPKSKIKRKGKVSLYEETTTEQESEDETPRLKRTTRASSPVHGDVTLLTRKRCRSLDNLLNEDSGDDLDTIITLSSRSSRAAKEKATAKLKSMMENIESGSIQKRPVPEEKQKVVEEEEESVNEGYNDEEIDCKQKAVEEEEESLNEKSNDEEIDCETISEKDIENSRKQEIENKSVPPKPNEMVPPPVENKSTNGKELNVFICRNDILQEQAKVIEEDRLRQMDELNKSFAAKPKLDFINKLSNRLNSTQQVQVKIEPELKEIDERPRCVTPNKIMPVLEKQPIVKIPSMVKNSRKPLLDEETVQQTNNIEFRQNKSNSLFSNMIEKLQGKINEAVQEDSSKKIPVQESANHDLTSGVFISIGDLIRATKVGLEIVYSCHAQNCTFTTKDKKVFQLHCKFGSHTSFLPTSSLCDKCGVVITVTQDTTILENLYDHLLFAHSDFINPSLISPATLRMRRLSGDILSIKKETEPKDDADKEKTIADGSVIPQDFEIGINTHVLGLIPSERTIQMKNDPVLTPSEEPAASVASLELSDDNPFSFKIANVMSLADDNASPATSPVKLAATPLSPLKLVPPLTLINQEDVTSQSRVIKEAKLTMLEANRPRKASKPLQSFIEAPGNLYKCPHFYCKFSTNVRDMFVYHLKAHKSDNVTMVPCVYCDMKTPWDHVPMHIDIRHAASRYCCTYCLYRAVTTEYVCLHLENCHPNNEYVVAAVPPHKAAKKFSAADSKVDFKQICEPFRCVCRSEDGPLTSHEYLFENEFVQHLFNVHRGDYIQCGYPHCSHKIKTSSMLNHWSALHGVCTYQCSCCKANSKEVSKMYNHFAMAHPNVTPDILVRKNESLPTNRELGFTDEGYQYLGHIRRFPNSLLNAIRKRSKHKKIKILELDTSNATEEASTSLVTSPPKTSPGARLFMPVQPNNSQQLLLANPNLKLLVAATSNNDKVLLLSSSPMVSQPKITSVTSSAPISKVLVHTSTASPIQTIPQPSVRIVGQNSITSTSQASARVGPETSPILKSLGPVGNFLVNKSSPLSPIRIGSSQTSTVSLMQSLQSQGPIQTSSPLSFSTVTSSLKPAPVRIGGITLYPPEPEVAQTSTANSTSSFSLPTFNNLLYTSAGEKSMQLPQEVLATPNAIISENESSALSEDDILQSAIQSILDFEEDSNNARLSISKPSEQSSLQNPPPLVLISATTTQNQDSEPVVPVEHINIPEPLEGPQNNEESGTEMFIDEDPLNLPSNSELFSLELTEVIPSTVETETNLVQKKISNMRQSVSSIVSNSDDESDSSISDKKKRGLMGYQLYRCAICNLSFSNLKSFKQHLSSSSSCKKTGAKAYLCVHCDKGMKTPQRLAEHIIIHGVLRFSCSLCNEKFNTVQGTKLHMKTKHSVHQFNMVPLKADKNDMEMDEFVIKPSQMNPPASKDKDSTAYTPKLAVDDCTYNPDQIDAIPIRQIFNTNVKCGKCNYQTKVRVNILRHLQMHLDEKAVPDTAPVNPVPCLDKNEKMFDKMFNLAASSFSTGRMGGSAAKENNKEEEKYPEFVPSHRRFVCCAQGCSYLCPEESNLKHHIMALHSDESNFTCAHCKVAIDSSDVENVIKHFKLHGLHLYKCHYCSFVNHLKHKVEKHISDGHIDMAVKVVTLRLMEAEPEFTSKLDASVTPVISTSKFKPWSCCMCKAKYHTKEEIQAHIVKKHSIDAQYKCTLCAFKDNQERNCREHFKEKHPDNEFDIIFVYRETEEEPKDDINLTPFDTTPLWQRDKPRVRHIRGILFDESSPQLAKSPKKKSHAILSGHSKGNSTSKSSPIATTSSIFSKNIFDCIDSVARGTEDTEKQQSNIEADTYENKPGPSGLSTSKTYPEKSPNKSTGLSINKTPPITLISKQRPSTSAEAPIVLNNYFSMDKIQKNDTLMLRKPLDTIKGKNDCASKKIESESEHDDVVLIPPPSPKVIVIDSDESDTESGNQKNSFPEIDAKDIKHEPMMVTGVKRPGTSDLLQEAVKMARIEETDEDSVIAASCSRRNLLNMYGAIGKPNNKQLKCPRCSTFRSKKAADFMFHLYQEFNCYRFQCKLCDYSSVSYKYMSDHLERHHKDASGDLIQQLPPNIQLETWIHMVIREQSKEILELSHELFKKRPVVGPSSIKCYFCNDTFVSVSECNEHMFYHWVLMPYQCQHCPNEFYTIYDLKHHHKIEHPDLRLYAKPKGPTLAQALSCIESPKKRVVKMYEKKAKEKITSGLVINTHNLKPLASKSNSVVSLDDDENDLLLVAKTEQIPSNSDEIFACEACAYYGDSEGNIKEHLKERHKILLNKFHILKKSKSEENFASKMACNVCNEIFTEIKLRQHFMDNHDQTYSPYKYKCLSCPRKYRQLNVMKAHCTKTHPKIRPSFQCFITKNTYSLDSPIKTKSKRKYSCSLCDYTSVGYTMQYIRYHVKSHFRPAMCNICQNSFRNYQEILNHTNKEHKESVPDFNISNIINRECNKIINEICDRATVVEEEEEEEAPTISKNIAKKSTASPFLAKTFDIADESNDLDKEKGYSFYGIPQPEVDLTNLLTTFELDELEYTTTAEQMMKMFNMNVFVDVSDCLAEYCP